ncbi:hypothetical protein D3C72_1531610 [compost metagenome]
MGLIGGDQLRVHQKHFEGGAGVARVEGRRVVRQRLRYPITLARLQAGGTVEQARQRGQRRNLPAAIGERLLIQADHFLATGTVGVGQDIAKQQLGGQVATLGEQAQITADIGTGVLVQRIADLLQALAGRYGTGASYAQACQQQAGGHHRVHRQSFLCAQRDAVNGKPRNRSTATGFW